MIINLQTISQKFLKYLMEIFIGTRQLRWYETRDWEQEISRFQLLDRPYPYYYTSVNYHGIDKGYLNPIAALTYDIITPLATPPNEQWIRQCLLQEITRNPQKILDLGCGTGSNTIALKEKFSDALIIGLDLSPYMLVMAEDKANRSNLEIEWKQGLAESTQLDSSSFDLITISLLLHETPNSISKLILKESFRLLKPKGQLIILDGNQSRLRHLQWLIKLFKEPYSATYSQGNIITWLQAVGFQEITAKPVWGIYQVTNAYKPVHY